MNGLHRREDLVLGQGLVERAFRGRHAVQHPDRRCVPGLDLHDATGGGEQLLRLERGRGAVVGADPGVLERLRELEERVVGGEGVAEVDLRSLHRLAAEVRDRRRQRVDVLVLVARDHLDERAELARRLQVREGLLVERRLQVLEREREVEDVQVALARLALRERPLDEGAHRERPVGRAGGEGALRDEGAPVHRLDVDLDLRQLGRGQLLVLHCHSFLQGPCVLGRAS